MKELNLKLLRKLGACNEAVAVYERRQETNQASALELLISGCEELENVDEKERLRWGNWLITKLLSDKDNIRYAIFAAEQVIDIFEKKRPGDTRPREAIEAAKKYLAGGITADAADAAAACAAADADAACAAGAAAYAALCTRTYAADAAYAAAADAACAAGAAGADAGVDYSSMLARILKYGIGLLKEE